jgi:hypothetical protein
MVKLEKFHAQDFTMTEYAGQAVQVSPSFLTANSTIIRRDESACVCQGVRGVPLGMSSIHAECPDSDPSDRLPADVLLRQEPDEEEEDEEEEDEDEDDGKEADDDDDDDTTDDGYSE